MMRLISPLVIFVVFSGTFQQRADVEARGDGQGSNMQTADRGIANRQIGDRRIDDRQADDEHKQWIVSVMESIATIKPGMTRRDLFTVLTTEGGISTRSRRRYIYKHCPYIKVDVEFAPIDQAADESPGDEIVKISQPFLEYSIMD